MDMITLAAAKAYTDEKLSELEPGGGGSGSQGEEPVIDLDSYGFSPISLALSGGGEQSLHNTEGLWDFYDANPTASLVSSYGSMEYSMRPLCLEYEDGRITMASSMMLVSFDGTTLHSVTMRLKKFGGGLTDLLVKVTPVG